MFKKILFQTHWFLGISLGLVLAVMGVTGGLMSFQDEIEELLNRESRLVVPQSATAPTGAAVMARMRARHPDRIIIGLTRFSAPEKAWQIGFADGRRGEWLYFNPYTLELLGKGERGHDFFEFVEDLHRRLLGGDVGKLITGIAAIVLLFFCLSGLYMRWPRQAAQWRQWFWLDRRLSGRSFLWRLHAVVGTWVMLFYLLTALTGLYWSFDWYRDGLYQLTGVEKPQRLPPSKDKTVFAQRYGDQDYHQFWSTFDAHSTDVVRANLRLPLQAEAPIEIRYWRTDAPHKRASNLLQLHNQTNAIQKHEVYRDLRGGEQLLRSMFVLHSGEFFGVMGTIIMMCASLLMPLFFITGWLLYLDRRRSQRAAQTLKRQLKPTAQDDDRSTVIGFASQSGNAEKVAWQTAQALQLVGVPVQVHALHQLPLDLLNRAQHALFIVSTFGDGEAPDHARHFDEQLPVKSLKLSQLKFSVLALGDRQYQSFCAFGKRVEQWLLQHGGQPLFARIDVDKNDTLALHQWQHKLAEQFSPSAMFKPFAPVVWHDFILLAREHVNVGSVGLPMYHLRLRAAPDVKWQAGDVLEIRLPATLGGTRRYSIASVSADGSVWLLIRYVRKADGQFGVASHWLTQECGIGQTLNARVIDGPHFHSDAELPPSLFIGNGSGVSSLRAHLKQLHDQHNHGHWLVFGERQRAHDFYYQQEIEHWCRDGVLAHVDLAFSRDEPPRYVQHALVEHRDRLRDYIDRGGHIYVCGSAMTMAAEVHIVLQDLLGKDAVKQLIGEARYHRDIY